MSYLVKTFDHVATGKHMRRVKCGTLYVDDIETAKALAEAIASIRAKPLPNGMESFMSAVVCVRIQFRGEHIDVEPDDLSEFASMVYSTVEEMAAPKRHPSLKSTRHEDE